MRREDQYPDFGCAVIRSKTGKNTPSVKAGEADIQDDDIRHGSPGCLEAHQSVLRRSDLGSGRAKAHVDQPPHTGGVFDYEHRRPHGIHHRHVTRPP